VNYSNSQRAGVILYLTALIFGAYLEMGILTKKSYDDCQHIGAAIISECDCIISWNFKHIVNIKTIRGIRAITNLKGHKPIEILNPSVLSESEE